MHNELTEMDIQKMKEEYHYRLTELTPKLIENLQHARDLGDLSENDEYRSAKRELGHNYSRMRYLDSMIRTAVVIKTDSASDAVGLFDKVTLFYEEDGSENVIRIVTTLRNDVLNGLISKESPFGKALLGHKVGDRVCIRVSDTYSYYVVVKAIEKGEDDGSLAINSY